MKAGCGFWIEKARIVESRICKGNGGFRLRGEGFLRFGLPVKQYVPYRAEALQGRSLSRSWKTGQGDKVYSAG